MREIRSDGLYYEDENKTVLSGAVPGTVSVVVSKSVQRIKGGTKESDGFSYSILSTLKEVDFSDAISLAVIDSYAFANTNLGIINLSNCISLETINSNAFQSCQATEILFPMNGILSKIESSSFEFSKLNGAMIPPNVTRISNQAFRYSNNFNKLEFAPDSNLQSIGLIAFEGVPIERVRIPKKATSIDSTCFADCSKLVEISVEIGSNTYSSEYGILYSKDYSSLYIFPPALQAGEVHYVRDGVKVIEYESFRSAKITGIVFPPSVTKVIRVAFWRCSQLKWANMTASVVSIGDSCFQDTRLEHFLFPTNILSVPSQMFMNCRYLKRVDFNGTITRIEASAFSGCSALESFDVMEGVTEIRESAFKGCSSLAEVWLPQSIEKLGGGLFEGCHPNLSVEFREEGRFETDSQFIIYSENKTVVIQMFATPANRSIVLPSTVTKISSGAFASTEIESIQLENGLQSIESRAFAGCSALSCISIPGNVSLGSSVFSSSSISSIDLGEISSIPEQSFSGCSKLTAVLIPSTVVSIGPKAFSSSALRNITFEDESSIQLINDFAFLSCSNLKTLKIPKSIQKLGSKICENSGVETIIVEEDSNMTELSYSSFMNSYQLTSITFSSSIKVLGELSLASCTSLINITITPSVTTFAEYCLKGCRSLENIIVKENSNLETIENSALYGLSNLKSIIIKGTCKGFSSSNNGAVLYNHNRSSIIKYCCRNPLSRFDIPSSVRSIAWCCFEDAVFLKSVTIPPSVSEISFRSFAGCVNLSSLVVADSVTKVGSDAFEDSNLQCGNVKYPKRIKQQLIDAGIPAEALDKCITKIFTINQDRFHRTTVCICMSHASIDCREDK